VPVDDDDLSSLAANKENLIYVRGGPFFYGRDSSRKRDLVVFNIKDRKPTVLAEDVSGTAISMDGSKVLVRQDRALNLYDASPKGKDSKKTVSTSGLMVDRVPKQEWNQHLQRGVAALPRLLLRREHARLRLGRAAPSVRPAARVRRAPQRPELRDGGARLRAERRPRVHLRRRLGGAERPKVALTGLPLRLDAAAGRYKISRISAGQNEEETATARR
jgi:hypothetical protein